MNEAIHIPAKEIILIGGSAGSYSSIERLLGLLPADFMKAVVIVVHRLRNANSEMPSLLSKSTGRSVLEPEDKMSLFAGCIFLAPQNYHLLAEQDGSVSLDYSEPELHARPSINVCFSSFATVYQHRCAAFLLSGLNNDGAKGLSDVISHGGSAYIINPAEAEYTIMPEAAKAANPEVEYVSLFDMSRFINR